MKTLAAALALAYLTALAVGADAAMPPRAMAEAEDIVPADEAE